jgi:PAS domain S-box-containing protein
MMMLAARLRALTFSTRLTAAMVALVWLTAAASYFGPVASVAAALLLTALAAAAASRLTRPLVRLSDAAKALGPSLAAKGPAGAGDEIGILAAALDRMAAEIDKAHSSGARRERRTEVEKSYGAAINSAAQAIIVYGPDGTITAWNPGAERLYGFTAEEAIGRSGAIIVPEDRRREIGEVVAKLYRDEDIGDFETKRRRKDRSLIDVTVHVFPIKDESGKMIGRGAIARDATQKKLVEEMFRLAVEACPSGMLITDRSGVIVLLNTEIERLFGYRRDELIGQSVDILVPAALREQHVRRRAGFVLNPETRRMGAGRDLFALRKDGSEFPVEVGLNPVHTREGVLVLAVIADISERKRIEHLKDEFVSTVSHELRTPLTSISGSLGLLVGNAAGKLPEPATRLLTIAHKNSQRLVRLINDILDIEKIESGEVVFDMKRVDVAALVEQAVEGSKPYAESLGVTIRVDRTSTSSDVRADPDRLAQVVTNLLSNAIKFSPTGAEVVVSVEAPPDAVRIAVRDHGPGVPAKFKHRIFERFAQADSTDSRQKGGTGLGLSIVKGIVTRLGGTAGFGDAPGGGSIFHVELPAWHHGGEATVVRAEELNDA